MTSRSERENERERDDGKQDWKAQQGSRSFHIQVGNRKEFNDSFPIPLNDSINDSFRSFEEPHFCCRAAFDSVRLLNRGAENTVKGL